MIRNIVLYGNSILRKVSKPVENIEEHRDLIEDLKENLIYHSGLGLAAPQIWENVRIIAVLSRENEPVVYINPEIIYLSKEKVLDEEGCLSFPNIFGNVVRAFKVKVKALDENGNEVVVEEEDYYARAFQHEIDHLDGKLFVDRLSYATKKSLKNEIDEIKKLGINQVKEFERGDVIYAGKKFGEAELLFPQSIWAPRAVLMSAYGYFSQGYYSYAINDLERSTGVDKLSVTITPVSHKLTSPV
jgi:peptide deformylase